MSLVLAAVLLAASAVAEPAARLYGDGETLDYQLSWMRITGGTARMTIGPSPDDPASYRITSVAKSSKRIARLVHFRDEIETTVARSDFSTLRYVKRLDERGEKKVEVTTVEDGVATRTRHKVKKVQVPRPVFDPISVIYYVRTLDLTPGRVHRLTLVADGKVYTVDARAVRRERVETPAGTFQTVLVEPVMNAGGAQREERLFIWYSDDERRIPVRIRSEIKLGSVTATLRAVRTGVAAIDPPALQGE